MEPKQDISRQGKLFTPLGWVEAGARALRPVLGGLVDSVGGSFFNANARTDTSFLALLNFNFCRGELIQEKSKCWMCIGGKNPKSFDIFPKPN